MKCPKCGFELADGQLYCESCGAEIQIVPDFEPEIENSIIESLSTVAEEIEMSRRRDDELAEGDSEGNTEDNIEGNIEDNKEGKTEGNNEGHIEGNNEGHIEGIIELNEKDNRKGHKRVNHKGNNKGKKEGRQEADQERNPEGSREGRQVTASAGDSSAKEESQSRAGLIISISSFFGVIILSLIIGVRMYHTYSTPYQIEKAKEYADAGDYQKAVEYMEKADALLPEKADILYTKAIYHYLNQEPEAAIGILVPMTQSDRYTVEEKEKCYERIIEILDEQERYQEISDLLRSCENEALVTRFQSYLAMEPEFSIASGSYREVIPLKLSSNTSGKIYYTLNGSKPSVNSNVYTAPIFLESGDYIVSALFVNDYGLESQIVRHSYYIDLMVPDPPEIALFSGLYVEPTMIEVTVPPDCEVYYTTNGNVPTADSTRYTAPIFMPLGRAEFTFITISAEGVSSDTVTRSFEFRLISDITEAVAVENIMQALVDRRVLIDMSGKVLGMDGYFVYQYDTMIVIPDKGLYYKIDEYYREGSNGTLEKTEHLYAVEAYQGTPNRLIYNEQGQMDLISLAPSS